MKVSNKKRILAFVMAFTVLFSGVIGQWSFLAKAAENEITLSWDGYYNYFVFNVTGAETPSSTEIYRFDSIFVDDVEIKGSVLTDLTTTPQFAIWDSYWYGTSKPTKSILIKAGTVLRQFDSKTWDTMTGGKTYTVKENFYLVSSDNGATWSVAVYKEDANTATKISLSWDGYWGENSFVFNVQGVDKPSVVELYSFDSIYVDGKEVKGTVLADLTTTPQFAIWDSYWGGTTKPTQSILIKAGTTLHQSQGSKAYTVTTSLYVTSSDGGKTWAVTPYEEPVADKEVALRFVVASDIHIANTNSDDSRVKYFKQMFETAYKYAEKDTNHSTIDAFVMVGDIVNTGVAEEYTSLKTLIDSANTENTPILTVNGNHEWWGDKSADKVAEKKQNYLNGMKDIDSVKTKEMNWSTEIKGYTFIGMSQESNDTFSTETLSWMSDKVESAIEKNSNKSVFTFQHLAPNNTVYGSKTDAGWDKNGVLNAVYEGHQQVINFSGHSHAPINTPTAINQTTYTQYTTGTLYYMELDGSASYGAQPAGTNPTAEYTIVEVYGDNTVKMFPYDELDNKDTFFKKLDGSGEQLVYEIDVNDKENWKYTDARKTDNPAPTFAKDAAITVSKQTYKSATIIFPQASDDTGVYAYDITCTPNDGGAKNYRIFSEWYFSDMKSELSYTIPGLEAGKTYTVSVVPVDFFGATGTAITATITTEAQAEAFSFSLGESTSDHFDLVPSNWDHVLGTYYKVPVTIDGTTEKYIVASHRAGLGLTVWLPSYLQVFDKDLTVNSSIEIKAGAVLKEITMTTGYPELENGDSITVNENVMLTKKENGLFMQSDSTVQSYSTVLSKNNSSPWIQETYMQLLLNSSFNKLTTIYGGKSFTSTILVDGTPTSVDWAVDSASTLVTVDVDNTIPTTATRVEIPAGTVLTYVDGKTLVVSNGFGLRKVNGAWETYEIVTVGDHSSIGNPLPEGATNLIKNGTFDSATGDWNLVGNTSVSNGMLKIDVTGTDDYLNVYGVPVTAGKEYVISYYIWIEEAQNLSYNMYTSPSWKDNVMPTSLTAVTNGWQKVEFKFTANTTGNMQIGFKNYNANGSGTIYIDDLLVYEAVEEEPTPSDVTNATFEIVQVASNQLQFYAPNDFATSVTSWTGPTVKILIDGVEKNVTMNLEPHQDDEKRYFWLQGTEVTNAIKNGSKIQIPETIQTSVGGVAVTFNFKKNMTIAKLGTVWAMYTSEYTYPNGDNKFYYNIDNGTSYKLTSSNNAILVKELPNLTTGDTIDKVGAYNVTRIENEVLYKQVVVLYKHGDANEDNKISAVDLIAMKKVAADSNAQPTRLAGTYAADINRDGKVNDDDLTALRKALVSADAAAELKVAKGNSVLNGVMPIVGYGVYDLEGKTTDELYSLVSDLGINAVSFNNKEYSTPSLAAGTLAHLQSAEKNGIGVYVQDNHLHQGGDFSPTANLDTMITDMSKRVGEYSMYKSFLGTYVVDEPVTSDYHPSDATESNIKNKTMANYSHDVAMMKKFTNLNTYVNLLPYYSSKNSLAATEDKYNDYLDETFKNSDLDMLSFDNYPVGKGKAFLIGSTKEVGYSDFYTNLRLARTAAQEKGTPFWAFAQAGLYSDSGDKINSNYLPTKADQQWEISASLACGAKGVQYFSVVGTSEWTASGKDTDRAGLIKADGTKNNKYGYYDAAKETNTFVATVDHVLMNADNKGVITNDKNAKEPLGDMVLNDYKEVTSVKGTNALVGCFDYFGKTALLVVNCNTSSTQEITLNFDGTQSYEMTDYVGKTTTGSTSSLKMSINAGQCTLVVLN